MNKLKSALCLCMAGLLLLLAACGTGGTSDPGITAGRYVEANITPTLEENESLLGTLLTPEGNLVAYSNGLKNKYESADGGATWQKSEGPGAQNPQLADAQQISMADDGTLLVLTNTFDETTYQNTCGLFKITPDGAVQPFAQKEFDELVAEGKSPYVMQFMALPAGRVLLQYDTAMYGSMGGAPTDEPEDGSLPTDAPDSSTPPAEPDDASTPESDSTPDSSLPEGEDDTPSGGMQVYTGGESVCGLYDINTGEQVANLGDAYFNSVTADKENMYAMTYSGEIEVYSLADGSKKTSLQAKSDDTHGGASFDMSALTTGQDGKLYALDAKQLRSVNPADDTLEVIFNSNAFAIANPNNYVNGVLQLADGSFVAQTVGQNGTALYHYYFDPDAAVDPNKVLRIWALNDNSTVRAAISSFMNKHPDATVEFEVGLQDGSGQTADDAISALNTSILANEGPDIIILDGCPVESFAQKGMLLDLTGKVDTGNMYQQIRTPFENDGKTYYLPMRFKVPMLVGAQQDITSITTLQQFVDAVVNGNDAPVYDPETTDMFAALPKDQQPVASFDSMQEVFDLLWAASSPEIVTSDGLNADNLKTMLEAMKAISDKYKLAEDTENGGGAMMSISAASGEASTITGSPIAYASGRAQMAGFTVGDLVTTHMMNMDGTSPSYASFPGLTSGAWQPFVLAGVNASTKHQSLATEFMQIMLSDDVQGVRTVGFPVTDSGAQIQIKEFNDLIKENENFPDGFSYDMNAMMQQLQTPVLTDNTLASTFYTTAEKYCRGEIELDAAVAEIQQALSTYLAERE